MKNTLITEINRIHTLMGVNSKILNESVANPISDALGSLYNLVARKLLDDVVTATPNPRGGVNINGKTYAQADFDELNNIIKALDDGTINASELSEYLKILPKSTQNTLAQIIKSSEGSVDDFYEQFIKSVYDQQDSVFDTEEKIIQAILRKMDDESKNVDQVLDEIFTEDNYTLRKVLEDKIKKNINDLKSGNFKPSVPRRITRTITLTQSEIRRLINAIKRSQGPEIFLGRIKEISSSSLGNLMESSKALDNGFREACKGKTGDELVEITNAYAVQMNRIVNKFYEKFGTEYKQFLRDVGVDEQLINKITNPTKEDGYFWAWKQLRDNPVPLDKTSVFNMETFRVAWEKFRNEMNLLWNDIKIKSWGGTDYPFFINFENRFLSLIATGRMDNYQMWFRRTILSGWRRGKYGWCRFLIATVAYGTMLLAATTIALTIIETFWSYISSILVWGVNGVFNLFNIDRQLESDWTKSSADGFFNKTYDILTKHFNENFSFFFGEDGLVNALLGILPGPVGTLQNSWIQQVLVFTGGIEHPNTFPEVIEYILLNPNTIVSEADKDEAKKELKENPPQDSPGTEGRQGGPRETEPNTQEEFPRDLLDVMNDESENQLIRNGENIYWGSTDYPIKKSSNGVWRVMKNGKWYDINENM